MIGEYRVFGARADADPLTVVIADDQALVRGGFRLILKAAGINVAAEVADGAQAVAAVRAHRPDVVLMDVRMPVMDGIEATKRILASYPDSPADAGPAADPRTAADPRSPVIPAPLAGRGPPSALCPRAVPRPPVGRGSLMPRPVRGCVPLLAVIRRRRRGSSS